MTLSTGIERSGWTDEKRLTFMVSGSHAEVAGVLVLTSITPGIEMVEFNGQVHVHRAQHRQ